ncbi:MAG: hypothetical protein ACREAO_10670, partial [Nitrososphaera sp.]
TADQEINPAQRRGIIITACPHYQLRFRVVKHAYDSARGRFTNGKIACRLSAKYKARHGSGQAGISARFHAVLYQNSETAQR